MKGLIRFLLLLLPLAALAQSNLRPCPPTGHKHNCFGSAALAGASRYEGEFQNNVPNGQGVETFSDGQRYVGEFRSGRSNGRGTWTHPNGQTYVGEWRDDKQHGIGTFVWPDGSQYVGQWQDNKPHGQGIEYRADGRVNRSGQWTHGELTQTFVVERHRFPFTPRAQAVAPALNPASHSGTNRIPDHPLPPATPRSTEKDAAAVVTALADALKAAWLSASNAGHTGTNRIPDYPVPPSKSGSADGEPAAPASARTDTLRADRMSAHPGSHPGTNRIPDYPGSPSSPGALPRDAAAAPSRSDPLKAAWIYVGPVGNFGWSYAHEQGRKAVQAHFGDAVSTSFIENVPEGAGAERVIRQLAQQGHQVIFATSFGYMEAMLKVAADFPHVKFEHASGYKTAPNVRTYDAQFHEAAYLAGVIAGRMTRSNVLGFVASIPIPEVLRNINAFTLGAQSINPQVRTKVVWVNGWYEPDKEAVAAQALIDQQADVLMQSTNSTAVLQTAQRNGTYAFGWDSDMSAFAPQSHLASAVVDWAPYYIKTIEDLMSGSWRSARTVWGVKEGLNEIINISPWVPADARRRVDDIRAGLKDGRFTVFAGAITDNQGRQRLAAGRPVEQKWLDAMAFYVQGVEGRVPGESQASSPSSAQISPAPPTPGADTSQRRQRELEEKLAAQARERDRQAAELEAVRKRQQELEAQLAALQSQSASRVPAQASAALNQRRVALVIGNAAYKVSPLDNPVNDATDVSQALRQLGFQTTLVRDATLGQMREATRRFADQLGAADVALIYFAGHGIESNRRNFMIPVNADLKFEYELADQAYDAGNWLEMLESVKSSNTERVNIVILDACRNNSLIGARSLGRGLGRMDAPTGTFLAYSTAPGKVAADGARGQRNSPFTRHLLSAMQQPGLPIEEAFKEVRRNVSRETNGAQVPWESTSLTGFFTFRQVR